VARTISLVHPFYQIKGKTIVLCTVIHWITLIFNYFVLPKHNPVAYIIYATTEITSIIFIVITCLIICAVKLRYSDRNLGDSRRKRHATVTIFILSGFFCAVNIAYLCAVNIVYSFSTIGPSNEYSMYFLYASFVGVPFNSTVNPMIYFIRKSQMRAYIKSTVIGRFCFQCCCCICRLCRGKSKERRTTVSSLQTQNCEADSGMNSSNRNVKLSL
jgi:heme/copper-type cytochrome/quinol oxidase subunit 2